MEALEGTGVIYIISISRPVSGTNIAWTCDAFNLMNSELSGIPKMAYNVNQLTPAPREAPITFVIGEAPTIYTAGSVCRK